MGGYARFVPSNLSDKAKKWFLVSLSMPKVHFEFVEFASVTDFLIGINAYFSAPGIRPFIPIDRYRGFLMHIAPLTSSDEPIVLVFLTNATLPVGVIEFDATTKQYTKVESISRPDKLYFVVVEPKFSTIAEEAIKSFEELKKRQSPEATS